MPEKHCETECREDILEKLSKCITIGGVWKFIGVLVAVLAFLATLTLSIHAANTDRVEQRQKASEQQIHINTVAIAKILSSLDTLEKGQGKIEDKLENLGAAIIREVKKIK
jgi:hypothetical protein